MNLYFIDSGDIRYFSKKANALKSAQIEANLSRKEVFVSKVFIATNRDNIALMANRQSGFTRFIGRVCTVQPRKRPILKLKKVAAVAAFITILLLPNLSDASSSCVTRRSGSVTITTCSGKNFYSQCRSYRSGSVVRTSCR